METNTLIGTVAEVAPQAGPPSAGKLANWEKKRGVMPPNGEPPTDKSQPRGPPQVYPPLEHVNTPGVPTAQAAHYLNRATQTLHIWACRESYPEGLRPVRINGRLAWPVAGIRAALGVA